jgi:phage gp29-like protein
MATETQNSAILDTNGQPIQREIASIKRDFMYQGWDGLLPDGDELARAKGQGQGVDVYDKLKTETVVADKLDRRILGLVSKPWEVTPGGEKLADRKAAEYVDDLLDRIAYDQLCKSLMGETLLKGRGIEEIMWGVVDGRIEPVEFKRRRVTRFHWDADGNFRLRVPENITPGELLPPNKFVVHRWNHTDENPYGLGLGPVLWWPVFFKRKGIAFWLTFADKFGNPTSVGKYPAGTATADQAKLLGALKAISQDTGIIVPTGTEIELLEATRSGIDTYEKLCRYMDEMIARAIIGEADSSRDAGGALKAAADNRAEVRGDLLQADSDLLTLTITRDLVRPVVEWNFPGAKLPRVWRNFEPPEDLKSRVEIDEKLHKMGYRPKDAAKHVSEIYGGDWVVASKPDPMGADTQTAGFMGKLRAAVANKKGAQPGVDPEAEGQLEDSADFAEGDDPENARMERLVDRAMSDAEPAMRALIAPIRKLVAESASFEEVLSGMAALYGEMPAVDFAEVMELAILTADLAGRYEVQRAADGK